MLRARVVGFLSLVLFTSCPSDPKPPVDGGSEIIDAGVDPGVDAGVDAGCPHSCGDGRVECGEVCDWAAGPCCNMTCDGYANGTVCRAAAGPCDVAEVCAGNTGACPADMRRIQDVCRPSNGMCDVEEHCDGVSVACPADDKRPATTLCRASGGACDLAELCTGSTDDCPANALVDAGVSCRSASGACDVAEVCDGVSTMCPTDVLAPAGATCRADAGSCDLAETCTGSSSQCPSDLHLPVGTSCRPALTSCDLAETCTGAGALCPADVWKQEDAGCASAKVTASTNGIVFPNTAIFTSVVRTVTFTNDGGLPHVPATMFSISGSTPTDFTYSSQCNGNLLPGTSCNVDVVFQPVTLGFKSATVIYSPPNGFISLNAQAIFPATLFAAPTVYMFGAARVNVTPTDLGVQITVGNGTGAAPTGPLRFTVSDPQFVLNPSPSNSCFLSLPGAGLAGGSSCNFQVQFAPTLVGLQSALLTITATPGGSVVIPLRGTGTP